MAEHYCSHLTCYKSEETATMYREESDHNEKGWFAVCGKHVSEQKCRDGKVTVIMSSTNRAAEQANAEILANLE